MNKTLKSRIAAGEQLLGSFVKTPSPILCEVLGKTDLDLLCLDAEHAPFDRLVQDQCLYALRSEGKPALVRVPSAAPEHTLNALDCGATGVVVPHVTSAEMAEEIAAAAHFGAGGRGYAGSTRAAEYTTRPMAEHLAASAAESVVIAQIEDLEALEAIDDIAAVDGIDCLFVGRIDLTVALGAASPADPEVVEAVEKVCRSAAAAGRPVGMFVGNLDEIPRWQDAGATLFLLSSDHGFLLQGAASLVQRFRGS
ncbi:aldolase [Pseudohalioglobus sediminis]|uniref:Aldolase n=1 Tax=Pseudohalioglobus sediminis TaxID=2606449 RepID=A0A5B0WRP8_9GAMM|nr:aldolase/citrate lyase family protein [Pseudohalioglobus sediminis]KAA1189128.1 aldolase [Pseudohalioglobus sediminis]